MFKVLILIKHIYFPEKVTNMYTEHRIDQLNENNNWYCTKYLNPVTDTELEQTSMMLYNVVMKRLWNCRLSG